jgi:hypothetical protein
MESLGYIFGMAGLSFALMAWEKIRGLRKEFDEMKNELIDSGIIIEKAEVAKK